MSSEFKGIEITNAFSLSLYIYTYIFGGKQDVEKAEQTQELYLLLHKLN